MAILSNVNGKFAVDSTGAIQFSGQTGTSGYVLKSNGNAAPTWVDGSTVIGGPYLPLSGGTLTGATATASGISFTVGGVLTGTTAFFNAGATNVVATFTSTDGIAGIALVDSSGNVELSASGNTFQVQPAGGVAALTVSSTNATFASDVNVQNAGTRIISLNYEDSINSIISHSGTNFGLESLNVRGDNIYFYTDYDAGTPKGNLTLTLDNSHNATFAGNIILNNNQQLQSKDTSGNIRRIMYLDNGDTLVIGNQTTVDDIRFDVDTFGEGAMFIKSNGNVGIGNTSPNNILSVQVATDTRMEFWGTTQYAAMQSVNDANSTQKPMRFDASAYYFFGGSVGIGTDSPGAFKLSVKNTAEDLLRLHNSTDGLDSLISFTNPGGTLGRVQGIDNGGLAFDTGNNAGGINTNVMFINNTGKVFIGKTVESFSTPGWSFATNGSNVFADGVAAISMNRGGADGNIIQFFKSNTLVGKIVCNAASVTYSTTSDYRLKEDLKDFAGLDMVSKIPVYDFKWKTNEIRSYGVVAHELQEILPEAVSGIKDEEEMQGVDYGKITPILIKAIQELEARIKILENK